MKSERRTDPNDIALPPGFKIEVFMDGLTSPIDMEFGSDGTLYIGDAGVADGNGKVLRIKNGKTEIVADGFKPPLTGITPHNGRIFVSHRGSVTSVSADGKKADVLNGLPSWGDHHNNKVVFDRDGRMVFGQGTATNTGVVGLDNGWVNAYPFFHDFPGSTVRLTGQNFRTENMLSSAPHDEVYTGPYSPFGVPVTAGETVKGTVRASGSILSANEDGSDLRLIAWGLRNPFRVRFDRSGRLVSTNHGMDVRGSRPVANSPDELYFIEEGAWYGWPDYTSGYPVTLAQFRPDNGPKPEFILADHPMPPPRPFAVFEPHAAIMGFDFNYGQEFPGAGDIYLAEFGSEAPETTGGKPSPYVGHRISRISPDSGRIFTFAINKSGVAASATGEGGFERPIDVKFGPDGSMYIADFGLGDEEEGFIAGSGVIWRIRRTG